MKLLTIDSREVTGRPGVLLSSGEILDLAASPSSLSESQWIPYSIVSILAAGTGGLEHVDRLVRAAEDAVGPQRERLNSRGVLLPFPGTELMAPIRRPGLVLVVDSELNGYIKSPNTAVGHGASVAVPWAGHSAVLASGMLAVVIGRSIFQANADEAEQAISGYTLMLDLSIRHPGNTATLPDWQQYIESKQFPGSAPIGPVIITKDEIQDPGTLEATALINGVDVATGRLYAAALDIPSLLAELSQRYAFRPGDLIALEPPDEPGPGGPRVLQPGDKYSLRLVDMTELEVRIT
jgi:2-keto-4-pentenoate hydratase/2-oxohepta-3-ene-1,7-dioic acid hydratase in catechol pathway